MGLEAFSFIDQLNSSNPVGATDQILEGDNHIRGLKLSLLNTLPNLGGAMTLTHTQLNAAAIKTEANTFTDNRGVVVSGTAPQLGLIESDAAVDNKNWRAYAQGGQFLIEAEDDARAVFNAALTIDRTLTSIDSVNLYQGTGKRLGTSASGVASLYSVTNVDTESRRLDFKYQDGTIRGVVGYTASNVLQIENRIHGANVQVRGENVGGVSRPLFSADPDGAVTLYHAGNDAFETDPQGVRVIDPSGSSPTLLLYSDDNITRRGFIQFSASGAVLSSEVHGVPVLIQAEDAGGTSRVLFEGDPDGFTILNYAGMTRFFTDSAGRVTLRSDTSTDTENRYINFQYASGTSRGLVGFVGSGDMFIRNSVHGGTVRIQSEDTGGVIRDLMLGDPDGVSALYHTGGAALRTADYTAADTPTGAEVRHTDLSFYPIGLAILPEFSATGTNTVAPTHQSKRIRVSGAAAKLVTFTNTGTGLDVAPDAEGVISNEGTGLCTVTGTGVTLTRFNGAASLLTGNFTLGQGEWCRWVKVDDTNYHFFMGR